MPTNLWKVELPSHFTISSPATAADRTIYLTSTDGYLYVLRPDGMERWRPRAGGATKSLPVLNTNANIYLAANHNDMSASNNGNKRWSLHFPKLIGASPAVTVNVGHLLFRTVALLAGGSTKRHAAMASCTWMLSLITEASLPLPSLVATALFILPRRTGCRHSTRPTGCPLAQSSWPMFHTDLRHTGRVALEKYR